MLVRNSIRTAVMCIALTHAVFVQGGDGDRFKVKFDRPVQIGPQTLPAGEYSVREMADASDTPLLEFSSGNTISLDAALTKTPNPQGTVPRETQAILEDQGADQGGGARLSRILVRGKSYVYEAPGTTASARSETPVNYVRPATSGEIAEVQSAETPAPTPPEVAQVAPAQPSPPVTAPAPAVTPAPQTPPAVVAQEVPAPVTNTPPIPATALGWAPVMLVGLTIAGAGLFLLWLPKKPSLR